jgi:hypothetical protein
VDGGEGVVELDWAEFLAEGGGAEGEDGEVEAGFAEWAGVQGWVEVVEWEGCGQDACGT